jgi:hypothetical protein
MVTMSEDQGQEYSAEVGRFMVFAAYGELMLDFQSLELTLYQFLILRGKPKTTLDQWNRKVEGWYGTTLGRLYGSVKAQGHLTQALPMNSTAPSRRGITSRIISSSNGPSSFLV